jgi:RNA polymerase sigma-70 factor (ECF subfamily)
MIDRSTVSFRTTQWTLVLATQGESPEARQALRALCEAYYAPVEAFVRRCRPGQDDARDLTHAFFARLLEGNSLGRAEPARGRFRSYLLGAVKHFLADERDRARAMTRGGGRSFQSLDADAPPVADAHAFPPDAFFDRQWALAIVETAITALHTEAQTRGEAERFAVLKHWLVAHDEKAPEAARSLGLTEGAFKVAVHRLRKRFRQLVKDQIASTVDGPEALQGELDYLIAALTVS